MPSSLETAQNFDEPGTWSDTGESRESGPGVVRYGTDRARASGLAMPVTEWGESARPLQTLSIGEYWVGKDDTFCIMPELLIPGSTAAGGQTTVEFTNEAWTMRPGPL